MDAISKKAGTLVLTGADLITPADARVGGHPVYFGGRNVKQRKCSDRGMRKNFFDIATRWKHRTLANARRMTTL
jgi:hypothetical protein